MKILGIDSSGLVASVAIVENDVLLSEYTVNHKKTHSQTLLPMLDEIVKMLEGGDCKRAGAGIEKTVDFRTNCRCFGI